LAAAEVVRLSEEAGRIYTDAMADGEIDPEEQAEIDRVLAKIARAQELIARLGGAPHGGEANASTATDPALSAADGASMDRLDLPRGADAAETAGDGDAGGPPAVQGLNAQAGVSPEDGAQAGVPDLSVLRPYQNPEPSAGAVPPAGAPPGAPALTGGAQGAAEGVPDAGAAADVPGPGQPTAQDCVPLPGHVKGPAEHQLCRTHGHVIDIKKRVVVAKSVADYLRGLNGDPVEPELLPARRGAAIGYDCLPIAGHVPGPKQHQLCRTHGHVLDLDRNIVIAPSLKEYLRLKAAGTLDIIDPDIPDFPQPDIPDPGEPSDDEEDPGRFTDPDEHLHFVAKWLLRLRKFQAPYAIGLCGEGGEDLRLNFHRERAGKVLAAQLRLEAEAQRTTFGMAMSGGLMADLGQAETERERTLVLSLDGKPIPQLAKRLRRWMREGGISTYGSVSILQNGVEVDAEREDPGGDGSAVATIALDQRTNFGLEIEPDNIPVAARADGAGGTEGAGANFGAAGDDGTAGDPVSAPLPPTRGGGRVVLRQTELDESSTEREVLLKALQDHFGFGRDEAERYMNDPTKKVVGKLTDADRRRGFVVVRFLDDSRANFDPATLAKSERGLAHLNDKQRAAITRRADALFWEKTQFQPGKPIDPNNTLMVEQWRQFRAEAIQEMELANLPEHVKSVLRFEKDGVLVQPRDYMRIIDIAGRLQSLSPEQIADFANRSNARTDDLDQYLRSVEAYVAEVQRETEVTERRIDAQDALLGTRELYDTWKLARQPLFIIPDGEEDLHRDQIRQNARIEAARKRLPDELAAAKFPDKKAFEDAVHAFETSVQDEAVMQANQALQRREHDIFALEQTSLSDKGVTAIIAALGNIRAQRAEIEQKHTTSSEGPPVIDMAAVRRELAPILEAAAAQDPNLKAVLDFSRSEDLERKVIGTEFMDALSQADSPEDLKLRLDALLQERKRAITDTRTSINADHEKVWSFDKAISKTVSDASINPDDATGQIIADRKSDLQVHKVGVAVGLAAAAMVAGCLSGGTGAVAIAAAAVEFGLAGFGAYEAIADYQEENKAHLAGLSSTDPSFAWVVVALVSLPIPALSTGSALAKTARFMQLSEGARKAEVIAEILQKNSKAATALTKFNAECEALKAGEDSVELVKRLEVGLKDNNAAVIAAILPRAQAEADAVKALKAQFGGRLLSIDPSSVGLLIEALGSAVFNGLRLGLRSLEELLAMRELRSIGLSLDALKAKREALMTVNAAVKTARANARHVAKAAAAHGLNGQDIESLARFWSAHPQLTPDEVIAQMPVIKDARLSLGDISKLANARVAYAESLADAGRMSAAFRRLKLSPEDINAALDYRRAFPSAPLDEFIDSVRFFKSKNIKPSKAVGRPSDVLRQEGVVKPPGKAVNPHPPANVEKAARRVSAPTGIDDESRKVLRSVGQSDEIAGTGGVEKIVAREAPDGSGAVKVEMEGGLGVSSLQRDTSELLKPGQRYAPNFNGDGPSLSSLEVQVGEATQKLQQGVWQRLHLWGPGFGDEAKAGMFIGPADFNLAWQNAGIEDTIRELARQIAPHADSGFALRIKASAMSWGKPTPKQLKLKGSNELFLKDVSYTFELTTPKGTKTARVQMTMLTDPADVLQGANPAVHVDINPDALNALFAELP
jgi:hypothetical protein